MIKKSAKITKVDLVNAVKSLVIEVENLSQRFTETKKSSQSLQSLQSLQSSQSFPISSIFPNLPKSLQSLYLNINFDLA